MRDGDRTSFLSEWKEEEYLWRKTDLTGANFLKTKCMFHLTLDRNTPIPEKIGSCMQARLNSPPATKMADEISEELGNSWFV